MVSPNKIPELNKNPEPAQLLAIIIEDENPFEIDKAFLREKWKLVYFIYRRRKTIF